LRKSIGAGEKDDVKKVGCDAMRPHKISKVQCQDFLIPAQITRHYGIFEGSSS
jgi:hypothetical protein